MRIFRTNKAAIGSLCAVLAGVCWGTTGTLQALAPAGLHPLALGGTRLIVASLLLFPAALHKEGSAFVKERWSWIGLLTAGGGMALYQLCFFAAVRLAGVGVGTMIAIGTAPIIAGLMARFFFGERLFLSWWMATFLAIAGCYLLVFGWGEIGGELNLVGVVLALCAAFGYSLQGIGLRVLCKDRNSFDAAVGMTMTGALFCLPVVLYIGVPWLFTAHGALIVMVLVLFSTITPYILFSKGLEHISIGKAYTLTLTEPLTACLLAVFLLGETLDFASVAGVFLVFCAVFLLARGNASAS